MKKILVLLAFLFSAVFSAVAQASLQDAVLQMNEEGGLAGHYTFVTSHGQGFTCAKEIDVSAVYVSNGQETRAVITAGDNFYVNVYEKDVEGGHSSASATKASSTQHDRVLLSFYDDRFIDRTGDQLHLRRVYGYRHEETTCIYYRND